MAREEQEACVRGLFLDPRFAGVLGYIVRQREEHVAGGCGQELAGNPGKQGHAWGSVFALEQLLNDLKGITARGNRRREEEAGGEGG